MNAWTKHKNKLLILITFVIGVVLVCLPSPCQDRPEPVVVKEFETITETIPDEATQRQLNKLAKENEELNARLKELKAKPKIIIQKETVVEGAEYEETNIPSHFIYRTSDGLVVAEHSTDKENFKAQVYDIKVESKDVISEDKDGNTFVHSETKVSTSYDDEEVIVLSEPTVLKKKEKPQVRFEPLVELQAAADLTELTEPKLRINTGVYAGVEVDTPKVDAWAGVGVDISNKEGPMPALKIQVKF